MAYELNYISESERFDKDFSVADQKVRAAQFAVKQDKFANLREERHQRENRRFENLEALELKDNVVMQAKIENNAGKKNMGGAAFNIVNQDFDVNNKGDALK